MREGEAHDRLREMAFQFQAPPRYLAPQKMATEPEPQNVKITLSTATGEICLDGKLILMDEDPSWRATLEKAAKAMVEAINTTLYEDTMLASRRLSWHLGSACLLPSP
jgi:hypothetical protein